MNFQAFDFLFLSVLLMLTAPTLQCNAESDNQCDFEWPECCLCCNTINVTIIVRNELEDPTFEIETTVSKKGANLLSFLERAVESDNGFRFKSTYYASPLGYFIDTINGVTGSVSEKKFWHIISVTANDRALECGVSSYIPKANEVVLFNFTTYAAAGYSF